MKLSSRARYALRMMLDIAHYSSEDQPISLTTVAEHTGLSRGYLEQVAAPLRSAGLIHAVSGRSGGYRLVRQPQQISLGDIIEATIGRIYLVDCLEDPNSCLRTPHCECRVVYALINMRISEVLHGYTLADLLDPSWIHSVGAEIGRLTGIAVPGARPAGTDHPDATPLPKLTLPPCAVPPPGREPRAETPEDD